MKKILITLVVLFASTLCFGQQTVQPNSDFLVRLKAPGINTKTAAVGDEVRAVVEQPADFAGYEVIGHVSQAANGGKIKGQSVLQFKFERLEKENVVVPIDATLKQVTNSKGSPNVDEEGRAIKKKSHLGKLLMSGAGGAGLGYLMGGAKGAAIGAAGGAAVAIAAIEIAAEKGSDFELAADSRLLLTVSPARKNISGKN